MDINTCPRCGEKRMNENTARNALSRTDNKTYICSPCGTAEGMEDWDCRLLPQDFWVINTPA